MVFDADKPFWREKALTPTEGQGLWLLFAAHEASSYRPNISSEMVVNSCVGSGEYLKAIPAALLTLGGLHGPIVQAFSLLETPYAKSIAENILAHGQKVPGWGNSFVKGHDPIWDEVREWMRLNAPALTDRIEAVTSLFRDSGKDLYPNPACYTAAMAITLGIPAKISPWLFVQGRLSAWTRIAMKNL